MLLLFFLITDFLNPAVNVQIFISTAELAMPSRKPTNAETQKSKHIYLQQKKEECVQRSLKPYTPFYAFQS